MSNDTRRSCGPPHPFVQRTDAVAFPGERARMVKGIPLFVHWEDYVPRHLCSLRDVFFVQIGGACGVNIPRCTTGGDPIWEYATQCNGWRGVVVEPSAKSMAELNSDWPYGAHTAHVRTLLAAVASGDGYAMLTSRRGAGNYILPPGRTQPAAASSSRSWSAHSRASLPPPPSAAPASPAAPCAPAASSR